MLPGFRFLFAAIALSVSILVFGLGAAALLRAAHEQFASNSSWRAAPEQPMLAQQTEATKPVLAMLQVEPQAPSQRAEPAPGADPTVAVSPALSAPAEPESVVTAPPETAKVAALNQQEMPVPADPAKAAQTELRPVGSDTAQAPAEEARVTTIDDAKPQPTEAAAAGTEGAKPETAGTDAVKSEAVQSEPAKPEPAVAPALVTADSAATKVAALATTEQPPAKKEAGERTERSINKARLKAQQHAKARRRLALRARAVRQTAVQADVFGQPPTPARTP